MYRIVRKLVVSVLLFAIAGPAFAQSEIKIARQFGIGYLQFILMEHEKLIEKHAKAEGASDLNVKWMQVSGGSTINDGLISGSLDVAAVGTPPLVVLWAKTNGAVRAVSAMNSYPMYLNTRNPSIKSIKDFVDPSRIAVPAVKVSSQAIALQMAAANAFGDSEYQKLDRFTVSMRHPDAVAAMLSGSTGIDTHFTNEPFSTIELKDPKIRTIINSYEIYGGPATAVVAVTSERFRKESPKAYIAFYKALEEATNMINADKPKVASIYLEVTKDKSLKPGEIVEIIKNPDFIFTLAPQNIMQTALFMHKAGSIKVKASSWKDLFFPEVHTLNGS